MIDGIPESDFYDDDDLDIDEDVEMYAGNKCRHVSGIEGVITKHDNGYYWFTHSGGVEAFVHGGELGKKYDEIKPTPEELEMYLGHSNGLKSDKETASAQG